jgi:hypothetical protein
MAWLTQSSGKARYVRFFRDTAVKLPVIVGPGRRRGRT